MGLGGCWLGCPAPGLHKAAHIQGDVPLPTEPAPEWALIARVKPGDAVAFQGRIPALQRPDEFPEGVTWRTVVGVEVNGRTRILVFEDGSTWEAGHAYRLWVRKPAA